MAESNEFEKDATNSVVISRDGASPRRVNFQLESLILAQNERWRRA